MANKLIGDYIASGACGSAFDVVGHPEKVIKIVRLMNYKSPIDKDKGLEIGEFVGDIQNFRDELDVGWAGGIALNEFQAILFNLIYEKTMNGEVAELSPNLPKIYGFSTGEMENYLLDEITNSYKQYDWDEDKFIEINNTFKSRKGDIPGTRIGLFIMERVVRANENEKDREDITMGREQIKNLNAWLLEHNFVVRDSRNPGNWGFRDNEVVWFDIAVAPWPIENSWKVAENIKMRNLWWGFKEGFGANAISEYNKAIDSEVYLQKWWQVEEENKIIQFLSESEIVGKYIDSGAAGSVFAINGDKVLKIVRLDKEWYGELLNQEQADFIEEIYIDKMEGEKIPTQIVDIKHYNKGNATFDMVELINSKLKNNEGHKLKAGENIALWIMERIPTIGNGTMDWREVLQNEKILQQWGRDNGWSFKDLHDENYGQRADGSYVAFDMWPSRQ